MLTSGPPARIATLIDDHLRIAGAKDPSRLRQAWQIYAAHLLEYAYESFPQLPPHLLQQIRWPDPGIEGEANVRPVHADTYWWLKIILARIDGRLPAWESLRIVREQAYFPSTENASSALPGMPVIRP